MDDVIIFNIDKESHFKHLNNIFGILSAANMKVQLDKCNFLKDVAEYLGFLMSKKGFRMNPKKAEAIVVFLCPNNSKQLLSLLGIFNC